MLGGCRFDGEPGLDGHSDADAVAHAVADALLGAAGLGDIGQHFPDTDPALAGADSIELLRLVAADVGAAGWSVGNVDCSVVCERPKLAPLRDEMEARLTDGRRRAGDRQGRRAEGLGAHRPGRGHRLLRRRRRHAGSAVSGAPDVGGSGRDGSGRRPHAASALDGAAQPRGRAHRAGAPAAAAGRRTRRRAAARASAASRSRAARPSASC